jgi:hypothetical protein
LAPYPAVLVALLASVACGRSAKDKELDRIFEHQAAMRDTTGTIVGIVSDASSGDPLRGVFASTDDGGGMSDTTGAFTIRYVSRGAHDVVVQDRGYEAATVRVALTPPETVSVRITLHRAPPPCCELQGRWGVELVLDSAGVDQRPSARIASGELVLSPQFPSPWGGPSSSDRWVRTMHGQYTIDLAPFWGQQIAADVSTTVFGPTGPAFQQEATAAAFHMDSLTVTLIPRLSHGGISLAGRFTHADTVAGEWHQRAYCCGAYGRFRIWRITADPGQITIPPPIPARRPDTLPEAARADVRVRIWDEAMGRYIEGEHALGLPDGGRKSVYTTGSELEGWGRSFWLAPGRYTIIVSRFPCGSEKYFLAKPIERKFTARPGERTDITIRLDTRKLKPARSYNNVSGERCRATAPDSVVGGA